MISDERLVAVDTLARLRPNTIQSRVAQFRERGGDIERGLARAVLLDALLVGQPGHVRQYPLLVPVTEAPAGGARSVPSAAQLRPASMAA